MIMMCATVILPVPFAYGLQRFSPVRAQVAVLLAEVTVTMPDAHLKKEN
jgi:hypothetical protein